MANRKVGHAERERRRGLVARWRRSGESAAEFAGRHGVSHWALYSWAKQLGARPRGKHEEGGRGRRLRVRSVRRSATAREVDFIPVRLLGGVSHAPAVAGEGLVEIQLRGGDVVRVVGEVPAERLRAVVMAVRQAC